MGSMLLLTTLVSIFAHLFTQVRVILSCSCLQLLMCPPTAFSKTTHLDFIFIACSCKARDIHQIRTNKAKDQWQTKPTISPAANESVTAPTTVTPTNVAKSPNLQQQIHEERIGSNPVPKASIVSLLILYHQSLVL